MDLGLPGTGAGGKPLQHIPGQGAFAIPTSVQRIAEQGLWSTTRFPAGTAVTGTTPRFFSVALGNQGQGFAVQMSFSETNQLVQGQAPGDETYEISALSAEVYGSVAAGVILGALPGDLRLFQRIGMFRWEFGTVLIDIAALSMVGSGGGIFGATADTATPTTFVNNGNGQLWMYSAVVIAIPSTQRFAMQLSCGTAGQAVALAPTNETHIRLTLFNMARSAVPTA